MSGAGGAGEERRELLYECRERESEGGFVVEGEFVTEGESVTEGEMASWASAGWRRSLSR